MVSGEALSYLAPALIVTGSVLTAWNAGARVTGTGFIFLTAGQLTFGTAALLTGETYALVAASVLFAINGVGAWRWLRHVARIERFALRTERASRRCRHAPDIASARLILDSPVVDRSGDRVGTLEDVLLEDSTNRIAYYVVHPAHSHAGRDFVGVPADLVSASPEDVTIACSLAECPNLPEREWPLSIDKTGPAGDDPCSPWQPEPRRGDAHDK